MKKEKKIIDLEKRNRFQIRLINILLVVFFILVGGCTYLIFNDERFFKTNTPDKEVPKDEEPPVVENIHTNMEVSYFENLLNGMIDVNYLEDGFDNIEELSNQQKLVLLFFANNDYISELEEINIKTVDDYFKSNYNTTINHENIKCDINSIEEEYCYIYDSENQLYIENFINEDQKKEILSSYMNRNIYGKITNYTQENNTYTFTRYELYGSPCYDDCTLNNQFFSDVKSANNNTSPLINLSKEYTNQEIIEYNHNKFYSLELDINFTIYQNLMSSHIYTFKKIDNDYVLASYKINRLD